MEEHSNQTILKATLRHTYSLQCFCILYYPTCERISHLPTTNINEPTNTRINNWLHNFNSKPFSSLDNKLIGYAHDHPQSYIVTGDSNGSLIIWDLSIRRIISCKSQAHCSFFGVLALALLPDEFNAFLSQGRDGMIRAWKWFDSTNMTLSLSESSNALWQVDTKSKDFCPMTILNTMVCCTAEDTDIIKLWHVFDSGETVSIDKPMVSENLGMCMSLKLLHSPAFYSKLLFALYENGFVLLIDFRRIVPFD